ncbi:MAG: hypothetical protein E3J21_13130 [Anaerolineales bacterium]|nr:MAG: hypothetical protein E3J21_13130 [Anaerolineales bacterium]
MEAALGQLDEARRREIVAEMSGHLKDKAHQLMLRGLSEEASMEKAEVSSTPLLAMAIEPRRGRADLGPADGRRGPIGFRPGGWAGGPKAAARGRRREPVLSLSKGRKWQH